GLAEPRRDLGQPDRAMGGLDPERTDRRRIASDSGARRLMKIDPIAGGQVGCWILVEETQRPRLVEQSGVAPAEEARGVRRDRLTAIVEPFDPDRGTRGEIALGRIEERKELGPAVPIFSIDLA